MDDDLDKQSSASIPGMPIPHKHTNSSDSASNDPNLAANLIREKLRAIYGDAPKADQELAELKNDHHRHSKHQNFILELQNSGKSLVKIQTEWHNYYVSLPDSEKNQVWQEFYSANKKTHAISKHLQPHYIAAPENLDSDKPQVISQQFTKSEAESAEKKTAAEIKKELIGKVQSRSKSRWFQRFHSLIFGLAVGFCVILIFLFSFFNDRFLAPFITPSRNVGAQSLITDPNGAVSQDPLIIIPKINVEIPVIYTVPTIDENQIENNLENGVVHYPTTALPGQNGNGAIFGHSSNNILNPGKYKFAFVLLHDLQIGDTFTLDYQGKAYVYEIFQRQIVSPNDVSVLNNIPGHQATFTLITCDPPGTSINRLVVVGDQISPNVSTNTAGPDQNHESKPASLPSNAPSLWSRLINWL
jgi:sortase A